MNTIIDKILFTLAIIIGSFVFVSYISDSYILGLLAVILITILGFLFAKYYNKKENNTISKKEYWRKLLLEGKEYIQNELHAVFSVFYPAEKVDNSVVIQLMGKRGLIYNAFKFNALSEEDIALAYRLSNAENIDTLYLFYNNADRRALTLSNCIPQKVKLLSYRNFYKIAAKAEKLPNQEKTPKQPRKWKLIIKSIFSYVNVRLFLFAGISTALLSFITPLKLYYLIFSAINIIFAIIIAFVTRKEEKVLL